MGPSTLATREAASHGGGRSRRRFVRHYLEMVAVMMVSMMLLGGLFWGAMALLGHGDLRHYVGVRAFVMTMNMVVGMTLWMRFRRGHGWASTLEMAAAMVLPFLLLIGPYWAGLVSGEAFLGLEHMLMLPFMLVAMLRRYGEYARVHAGHSSWGRQNPPTGSSPRVAVRGDVHAS